jgi:hypothetical protein
MLGIGISVLLVIVNIVATALIINANPGTEHGLFG